MTAPPFTMPLAFVGSQQFELQRVDYLSPEVNGRLGGVQAGFPLWVATWMMGTIGSRKSDEVRAFITSLRGAQRRFIGYEVGRETPRFHRDGKPFTHAPASWSQTIAADGAAAITLTGVQPGMVLAHGDYIGFIWDDWKRALVRCVDLAQAEADGSLTVAIEPPVPTLVPSGASLTLKNPACLMRATSETKAGTLGRRLAVTSGAIVAVQDLVA